MKTIFTTLFLVLTTCCTYAQIISQYVETNSGTFPKAIEIWNNTGAALDFSTNNLLILKGTNGAAPSTDVTVSSGTLAPGAVMVIGTADVGVYLTDHSLTSTFVVKAFTFNGDDALVVVYGTDTTDVFGQPGIDPGSSWDGNGVSTANQNITLLSGITTGAPITGFADPSTRFSTTSSTPVDTANGGLAGFGVAPTLVPASLEDDHIETHIVAGGVKVLWSVDEDPNPFFIERQDAWGNIKNIYSSRLLMEGSIMDRDVYNSTFVYTIYRMVYGNKNVLGSTMVDIKSTEKLVVSPNPSKNFIEVYPIAEMESLHLYSVDGKELLRIESPSEKETLDISHLDPGMYFVSTGSRFIKITKE